MKRTISSKLTSVFFFEVAFAQQNETNFEGKHSNLSGSLTETYKACVLQIDG